jgi:ABC-type Fe3+-citrate transport system substrate-binding protein
MNRAFSRLVIACSLFALTMAERSVQAAAYPLVFQHDLGQTTIPKAPSRIVVLELSFVETLAALGLSPVGVADDLKEDRILPDVKQKIAPWTSVGLRKQPSLEKIVALKPDLIIADSQRHKSVYPLLASIAPTIALPSLGANYATVLASVQKIGLATAREKEAQDALASHAAEMKRLAAELSTSQVHGSVLFGVATAEAFTGHSTQAFTPGVLAALKGDYIIKDPALPPLVSISFEHLIKLDPDILIIGRKPIPTVVDEWHKSPFWGNLKAVKRGLVFEVNQTLWSRSRGMLSGTAIARDYLRIMGSSPKT